jgi:hypothetical protein
MCDVKQALEIMILLQMVSEIIYFNRILNFKMYQRKLSTKDKIPNKEPLPPQQPKFRSNK